MRLTSDVQLYQQEHCQKNNHITVIVSRIHKHSGVSTTKNNLIPCCIDSTTIRPLKKINTNYVNLSSNSDRSSTTLNHQCQNMPFYGASNFTHIKFDFNKWKGRAEPAGHHHSFLYLDEVDVETTRENDC